MNWTERWQVRGSKPDCECEGESPAANQVDPPDYGLTVPPPYPKSGGSYSWVGDRRPFPANGGYGDEQDFGRCGSPPTTGSSSSCGSYCSESRSEGNIGACGGPEALGPPTGTEASGGECYYWMEQDFQQLSGSSWQRSITRIYSYPSSSNLFN
jgi:hypothetical protein